MKKFELTVNIAVDIELEVPDTFNDDNKLALELSKFVSANYTSVLTDNAFSKVEGTEVSNPNVLGSSVEIDDYLRVEE